MIRVGRAPRAWLSTASAALLLSLLAAGAALSTTRAAARADGPREFTPEEAADLRSGKLVVRPEQRMQGDARLIGGMAWQLIEAPAARVWETLLDVDSYPSFLPAVSEARLLPRRGGARRVLIEHEYSVVHASYCVLLSSDPKHAKLRFRLDHTRPASIRDAYGELRVTPRGADKSVVSMVIMADVGGGFITGFLRGNVHTWMLRVPEQLKQHVERTLHEPRVAPDTQPAPAPASPH